MISLDHATLIRRRFLRTLVAVLLVGVEAAWLGALVAVAAWVLLLR